MTYIFLGDAVICVNSARILNSVKRTFVHKSIEKTQKFKYFWVFLSSKCCSEWSLAKLASQCLGVTVNRFHQRRHMFGGRKLADAMTQVKNVRGAGGLGVGVWLAKTV
jgi:hypothetical protein